MAFSTSKQKTASTDKVAHKHGLTNSKKEESDKQAKGREENIVKDELVIGRKTYQSRLFLGSGKFSSHKQMVAAIEACKAQVVTMALRRIDLKGDDDGFLKTLSKTKTSFLPNTSGARSAEEAVRISRLCAHATNEKWVKLEVTPNANHLLPDPVETLKAATILTKEGFEVYPYINADPVLCKRLEEIGCPCVMPLGSPIGSNRGLRTLDQLMIIIENTKVPVIVDAGIGSPSQACHALEIGADAVMINTAIATANDPASMSKAFYHAVIAGRQAFLANGAVSNEITEKDALKTNANSLKANASSPLTGFLR